MPDSYLFQTRLLTGTNGGAQKVAEWYTRWRPVQPRLAQKLAEVLGEHLDRGNLIGAELQFAKANEDPIAWQDGVIALVGFLPDEKAEEAKAAQDAFFGENILTELAGGKKMPILTHKQIIAANKADGLNLFTFSWHQEGYRYAENEEDRVVLSQAGQLLRYVRGYYLKRYILEGFQGKIEAQRAAGFLAVKTLDATGRAAFENRLLGRLNSDEFLLPNIAFTTRDMVSELQNLYEQQKPIPQLFLLPQARLLLSEMEKTAVLLELNGYDAASAVSYINARKRWSNDSHRKAFQRIYNKMEDNNVPGNPGAGRPKKEWALAYLRNHPEELRPWPLIKPEGWT